MPQETFPIDLGAVQPFRLVIRLHLGNEFRIAALCLDDGCDRECFAPGVFRNQAVRYVRLANSGAVLGTLDGMFLDENPSEPAFLERADKLVKNIRMIRKRHLRR